MSKTPSISLVVRAYNEEKHLPKLFERLERQTVQNFEVILVDSGSTDQTAAIARSHGANVVPILKKEFSFGRALNIGCKAANAPIFLIASAHVYPEFDHWLELILKEFKDPAIGLVYGRQRAGETNKFSEGVLLKNWFPDVTERHQDSAFCNNANCAIRKSIWETIPYDEALTGLEDLAWAKAIKTKGWGLTYNHEASIIHIHEETWKQIYNRYFREAIALAKIDPMVRMTMLKALGLFVENTRLDMRAARKDRVLKRHAQEIIVFRFLQFIASWRGLNNQQEINNDLIKRFYYPTKDNHHA